MKKLLISGLAILLAVISSGGLIIIWGSYLIPTFVGAAVTFYLFSYTIRNTIFRNNKQKKVWIYSAVILTIIAPPMAGFAGADGGSFELEMPLLQFITGIIYILIYSIYSLIGESSVKSTDFGSEQKGKIGKVFIIIMSVITYGFLVFGAIMSILVFQSNPNLFI